MNKKVYLQRIGLFNTPRPTEKNLHTIHANHVRSVPFENLDIHLKRKIVLTKEKIYKKIVTEGRGGFCYELNYLLYHLLIELGFSCKIVEARIFASDGKPGPPFDHMALIVKAQKTWLLDVGFGDLFLKPLDITESSVQSDGRNSFIIQRSGRANYVLLMSSDNKKFVKKYIFNVKAQSIKKFVSICNDKQTNTNSYFVKNIVCTKPVANGRITIFNKKFIKKKNTGKREIKLESRSDFLYILKKEFDITLVSS